MKNNTNQSASKELELKEGDYFKIKDGRIIAHVEVKSFFEKGLIFKTKYVGISFIYVEGMPPTDMDKIRWFREKDLKEMISNAQNL